MTTEHSGGYTPAVVSTYERAARRLRSLAAEVVQGDCALVVSRYEDVESLEADAVVLSGSHDPWEAHDPAALDRFVELLAEHREPVLGICAGFQLQARALGGRIGPPGRHVLGHETIQVDDDSCLLAGLPAHFEAIEDHSHEIVDTGPRLRVLARSASCVVEVAAASDRPWWGTQFHPEQWSDDAPVGRALLGRFLELASAGTRVERD